MTNDEYIVAEKSNLEVLLEELIAEIRSQHELDRINNTVLARRIRSNEAPENKE